MKKDIELKFSKKENDVQIKWKAGQKYNAHYIFGILNSDFQKELVKRGLDIKTIKFSINSKS